MVEIVRRTVLVLLVHLVLILSGAGPAQAAMPAVATSDVAVRACDEILKGNYGAAIAMLEPAIDRREARAQTIKGAMLELGLGSVVDYERAVRYYRAASIQGDPVAMVNLGYLTQMGVGIAPSSSVAQELYQRAAAMGHLEAKNNLAVMAMLGDAPKSCDAVRILREAAAAGGLFASINLCRMQMGVGLVSAHALLLPIAEHVNMLADLSAVGRLVPLDPARSVSLYRSSAQAGSVRATGALGLLYVEGKVVERNLSEAARCLTQAAEHGNAHAQNNLANCYLRGDWRKDQREALRWYRRAAEQGELNAIASYVLMMERGIGCVVDKDEARRWRAVRMRLEEEKQDPDSQFGKYLFAVLTPEGAYSREAWLSAAHSAEAMLRLGFLRGLAHRRHGRDGAEGFFRSGANMGSRECAFELGTLLLNDPASSADAQEQGLAWLTQAADAGNSNACGRLGKFHADQAKSRGERASSSTWRQALGWFRKGRDSGNVEAMVWLADLYARGEGVAQDLSAALELLDRADDCGRANAYTPIAEWLQDEVGGGLTPGVLIAHLEQRAGNGSTSAEVVLGHVFKTGVGTYPSLVKAERWFQAAAEHGSAWGCYRLAGIFIEEQPGSKGSEGVDWLKRAALQGLPVAQDELGSMFANGQLVGQNYQAALYWHSMAAAQRWPNALVNLGIMYQYGQGVARNVSRARQYFQSAVEAGDQSAVKRLRQLDEAQP